MAQIPHLATPRLCLRAFTAGDVDAYASICADPEVMQFLGDGRPLTRPDAWRQIAFFLGHWHLRGYGMWALEERESGKLVGRIGFMHPEGWPGFELGWTLGKSWWGKGFATEGARAALEYAFGELRRQHVISLIDPRNLASIRVAERLGENVEGRTSVFGREVVVYGIQRGLTPVAVDVGQT